MKFVLKSWLKCLFTSFETSENLKCLLLRSIVRSAVEIVKVGGWIKQKLAKSAENFALSVKINDTSEGCIT